MKIKDLAENQLLISRRSVKHRITSERQILREIKAGRLKATKIGPYKSWDVTTKEIKRYNKVVENYLT